MLHMNQPVAPMDKSVLQPSHQQRVMRSLRRIIHAVDIYSRRLRSDHDITTSQLVTLQAIAERPMIVAQIAREIHVTPSTLVGILDRLEVKGLIARTRDREDRRLVQVMLSDKGREFLTRAPSPLQATLADALFALPQEEQTIIAASLETIVQMMEAKSAVDGPLSE